MSEIRVHIERLILDGVDASSIDRSTIETALSAAVEQQLLSRMDGGGHADVAHSSHATLRAPMIGTVRDPQTLGERAGHALTSTIAPLCLGEASGAKGSGRG